MPIASRLMSLISTPRLSQRLFIGMMTLLSVTACTFDLDDPTRAKARLAQDRHAECQKIYGITNAHHENSMTAYGQGLADDGTQTQIGFIRQAEVPMLTADKLESLEFEDQNLKGLSLELAKGLRQQAEAYRAMAPFADVERTIASANDRSLAHQAVVVQVSDASSLYGNVSYALEVYCEGGEPPSF